MKLSEVMETCLKVPIKSMSHEGYTVTVHNSFDNRGVPHHAIPCHYIPYHAARVYYWYVLLWYESVVEYEYSVV